ncbi:hypothetical protein LXL04_027429 [Taraxacum kok-saghyz]
MVVPATGTLAPSSILIEFWPDYRATTMEEMDLPSSVSGKAVQFLRQQHLQSRHTFESKIKAQGNSQVIRSGIPARCAGDSFIRRMVSFRKTERSKISFRKDGLNVKSGTRPVFSVKRCHRSSHRLSFAEQQINRIRLTWFLVEKIEVEEEQSKPSSNWSILFLNASTSSELEKDSITRYPFQFNELGKKSVNRDSLDSNESWCGGGGGNERPFHGKTTQLTYLGLNLRGFCFNALSVLFNDSTSPLEPEIRRAGGNQESSEGVQACVGRDRDATMAILVKETPIRVKDLAGLI